MSEALRCEHGPCGCRPAPGLRFCDSACGRAAEGEPNAGSPCGCGHAGCRVERGAERCRNPGCGCPSAEASEYCSGACSRAALGDIPPAVCECGHGACRPGDVPRV